MSTGKATIIQKIKYYRKQYAAALLDDIIPFWVKNSPDYQNGGYFTCLDRDGRVYDTVKFMWLQGRQLYMLAKLYNCLEQDRQWLELGRLGADFIKKFGRAADGDYYFALTATGRPLIQPYNLFSDYFCGMGLAQYARAAGDETSRDLALTIFKRQEARKTNPKKQYNKSYPGTRPAEALNIPIIELNFCLEIKEALPGVEADERISRTIEHIFSRFLNPRHGLFHEAVTLDPDEMDHFDGRLVCPGHGLECAWIILEAALQLRQHRWIAPACEILLKTLNHGWDQDYGGIFYFRDLLDKPPDRLDWDQKLWWVHTEALVALILAYKITGETVYFDWFEKVNAYAWQTFADPPHGEWFGYANRRGEILLTLKGGKWKGFFHLPRFLFMCCGIFQDILDQQGQALRAHHREG